MHIGARIGALAGPGEVLVSGTVRDLVLGSGIKFSERGLHTLKGVPGQWQLFAVADISPPAPLEHEHDATPSVTDSVLLSAGRRMPPMMGRALNRAMRARARRRR